MPEPFLAKPTLPHTLVVMAVSGCGKSLIGRRLAEALGGVFEDADDFHPPANIEKMRQGTPLDDADRWPWLDALRQRILTERPLVPGYVLACSALKQRYRHRLRAEDGADLLQFVYLQGAKEVIRHRMQSRQHFMPPALLDSQFAALEEPQDALVVSIESTPEAIVAQVLAHFGVAEPGKKG